MLNRRELLRATATGLVAGSSAAAQEIEGEVTGGPFDQPTARYDKAKQNRLPDYAFTDCMPKPLVLRPVAVGTYEDLTKADATPFGPQDPVRIGEVFHGVAREWAETPTHWKTYGCSTSNYGLASWKDKQDHFGLVDSCVQDGVPKIHNWGHFPIKCYKMPVIESAIKLAHSRHPARVYTYAGVIPGPSLMMRLGQPVIVRFQNHLEAEISVHLHGGHTPSHSDGLPSFYTLQGKSRDYFYPNVLPLIKKGNEYVPDVGESPSTMWYHDHGMDATGYNVSKGLAGFAPCFGERELELIKKGVLPGKLPESIHDPDLHGLSNDDCIEHPEHPGFYAEGKEPYHNPYDLPMVLQDKVIDPKTGQIAFSVEGHNGYLGDTFFVNGVAYPYRDMENRKYRLRILNGSNARVYRLRILKEADFWKLYDDGIDKPGEDENAQEVIDRRGDRYDELSQGFLRIGKDSWLWDKPLAMKRVLLAMANRADLIVNFAEMAKELKEGEEASFILVNTMPQHDGRGPKARLEDGGDPRVAPVPFDANGRRVPELKRPIGLMKFTVKGAPVKDDASIHAETDLIAHEPIRDEEIQVVREFIFERGKGAWQVNGRFYDPLIANATPTLDSAEEWVLRNGGGGWWHPIHIHLESHQLISYQKDFEADEVVDNQDPPALNRLDNLTEIVQRMEPNERRGLHDVQVLGPNTVARIRMRFRTFNGPFVFHCHNLEHEDMRMMFNFEPVDRRPETGDDLDSQRRLANIAPDARSHGNDVTLQPRASTDEPVISDPRFGELPWEHAPVPRIPTRDAGEEFIPPRPKR